MPPLRLKFVFSVCRLVSGGATLSLPYDDSFPAPRRTGLGVLHHPAPSLSPPRFDRSKDPSPSDAIHPRTSFADVLRPRAPARRPSETRRICCHGQNPHCVGPCIARTLSQTATRNASPALPGIDPTMGGSDFRTPPPVSLPFSLVHGCPPPADQDADLLGYRAFSMSGSTWPGTPGSTRIARCGAILVVACQRAKAVGTLRLKFSGLKTFKAGSTRYLYTSPAFAPTHRHARYRSRRKARYWARG